MNDFLAALLARSRGADVVRPRLPSRFEQAPAEPSGPSGVSGMGDGGGDAVSGGLTGPLAARGDAGPWSPPAGPHGHPAMAADARLADAPQRHDRQPPAASPALPRRVADVPTPPSAAALPLPRGAVRPAPAPATDAGLRDTGAAPPVTSPRAVARHREPAVQAREATRPAGPAVPATEGVARPATPAAPQAPAPRAVRPRPAPPPPAAPVRAPAGETVVHVSIGRVDVRLHAEPATQGARARAAPAVMGLEDYLRSRAAR